MKKRDDLNSYKFSAFDGMNGLVTGWRYEDLSQYFVGDNCLDLGAADGQGTALLLEKFKRVVTVDGSSESIEKLKAAHPRAEAVLSYFEDLDLEDKFDTIIMAHVLEHVEDPQEVLAVAKKHLSASGVIIIDVPNGDSLHREIGVSMGLLSHKLELNDADKSVGHRRVYTPETFKEEVQNASLTIQHFGGQLIKVLSQSQMFEILTKEQLKALFDLGKSHSEISAEMFIVASL